MPCCARPVPGSGLLAETGLLDGRQATNHWAFGPDFRQAFPNVELRLDEVLVHRPASARNSPCRAGPPRRQDLVLYLIGRFVSPVASQAIAKFELLERHAEGQAPYLPFLPQTEHGDGMVRGIAGLARNKISQVGQSRSPK